MFDYWFHGRFVTVIEADGALRYSGEEERMDGADAEAGSGSAATSESESSERDHEIPKKKRKMAGK